MKSCTCFTTKTMDVSGWPFCRPADPRQFRQNNNSWRQRHRTWQVRKKQPLPQSSSYFLMLSAPLPCSCFFQALRFQVQGKFFGHLTGSLHNIHLRWPCLRRFKTLGNFGDGVDAKHIWRNREPPLLQCSGCPRHVMVFCLCSNRDQTFLYISSSYSSIRLTQTPKHCARFRPEKAKGSSMISNYDEWCRMTFWHSKTMEREENTARNSMG